MEDRCSFRVFSGSRNDFRGHLCGKPSKQVIDGKPLCYLHTPEAIQERRRKREEKWDAEERDARERREKEKETLTRAEEWPRLKYELAEKEAELEKYQVWRSMPDDTVYLTSKSKAFDVSEPLTAEEVAELWDDMLALVGDKDKEIERLLSKETLLSIAESITNQLFTNGLGNEAQRLVLMSKHGKDLGGWCRKAVMDRVVECLEENKNSFKKA